jgi:hypothetical protein
MKKVLLVGLVSLGIFGMACKKKVCEIQVNKVTIVDTLSIPDPFCGNVRKISKNGNYYFLDVENKYTGHLYTFSDYNPNFDPKWEVGDLYCSNKMW